MSNDETAMVWDAATGERLHVLEGHAGSVLGVGFGADGSELYTSGSDGLIMRGISTTRGLARDLVTSTSPGLVEGVPLISPDAGRVLLLGERASILDVSSGVRTDLAVDASEIAWAVWHPNAPRVPTVDFSGEVRLWDAATGRQLAARGGRWNDNLGALAYTASGDGIVVADLTVDHRTRRAHARPDRPHARRRHRVRGSTRDPWRHLAVTASPIDPDGGTDVVFDDLDTGRVLHRTQSRVGDPVRTSAPMDTCTRSEGFEGGLAVIDVDGHHRQSERPRAREGRSPGSRSLRTAQRSQRSVSTASSRCPT